MEIGRADDDDTSWIHEEWRPDQRNDGWSFDEWNDRNCVGRREDCEQTHVTSVISFSVESSEWAKMNLDTRAVADTLPSNCGPEGIGTGSFYDWILDGEAWQFQGYGENGFPRSLDGRLMDAHEVLNSSALAFVSAPASRVAGIAGQEQDFYVKHKGGYTIPTHSKNRLGMRNHFEKLLDEYGKNELIPVCLEHDTPNFYLNRGVKSVETHTQCERS